MGWDSLIGEAGSYCNEDDTRITHQIVDRPDLPIPSAADDDVMEGAEDELDDGFDDGAPAKKVQERVPGRTYIQPQWIWDSINAGKLQRPDLYAPGAELPPHLSPWVKAKKGEYDPTVPLAEQQTAAEAEMQAIGEDEEESGDEDVDEGSEIEGEAELKDSLLKRNVAQGEGMDVELGSDGEDSEDEDVPAGGDWDGFEEEDDDDEPEDPSEAAARAHQAELEAEALGKTVQPAKPKTKKEERKAAQKVISKKEREAKEEVERQKMMMPNRKRKMYEKMVYSNAEKEVGAKKIREKKRKIDKAKA